MLEGDEAIQASKVFWAAIRKHGGSVTGDWSLGRSVHGDGVPLKKVTNFRQSAGISWNDTARPLLYYDGTVFGSGKKGLLLTENKMYVHCAADGQIWNIANRQAVVTLDADKGHLIMNDKQAQLTFPNLSLARSVRLYFEYLQNPISLDVDISAQRIWNPAEGSPLLTNLKQLGVKDEILSPLAGQIGRRETLVSHGGGIFFTRNWVMSSDKGPVKYDKSTTLIVEPEHHSSTGLAHSLTEAAKHPSPFHLLVAGVEAVMHATKEHTSRVLVKHGSEVEPLRLLSECNQTVIVAITTAAAIAGVQVSVIKH